ncbi:MAG: tripartite tricarboxylate transporter substrate binding protein [Betaproteobacteria bacterium]|nr:tripartite tricarboxylate transporter substrate binding protein [Betaproteobacteria bacterium]
MNIRPAARLAAAALALCIACTAQAQNYPQKPVRIVIGQAAGGGMDILARLLAQKMSDSLGQPILVENKPGAAGIIGTEFVARSQPDGHTLLMGPIGNMVFNPIMYSKLPYSSIRDFVPLSMVATFPLILVVNASLPIQTMQDLVAHIKANPSKANYAGSGSAFQLAMELFKGKTDTRAEFIQYKSTNESIAAILAGDVLMAMVDTGPAAAPLAGGRLRALAVTSPKRLPSLADVPTMREAGMPELEFQFWAGLFAPAGTPVVIVKKLEQEVNRILGLADVSERMTGIQVTPAGSTSEEFARILSADLARWSAVAKAANIKPND